MTTPRRRARIKTDPAAAGLDAARLAQIGAHLRERYLDPGKIAGAQVAIVRRGVVGCFESFGLADRERGRAVDEETIFRLYSMTKPVTAVALLTLYEQGAFQLADPVHKFIPSWRDLQVRVREADGRERLVPAERAPTVRDVLTHTAGLGYGPGNRDLDVDSIGRGGGGAPGGALTLEDLCERLAGWPLRFQPGTRWLYSFGIDVAARLVEVLSGRRFDAYLRAALFEPLGMVDTAFWVPDDKAERFAACYGRNRRKELRLRDDPIESAYRREPSFLSGGGGLVGTTADYLRFAAMLAKGGELDGVRILGRRTVDLMATNHLAGDATLAEMTDPGSYGEVGMDGMGFGLGVAVSKGPAATGVVGSAGEFSWGGAASTTFWVDRSEALAVVFMTQFLPSGTFGFGNQLRALVYGAIAD